MPQPEFMTFSWDPRVADAELGDGVGVPSSFTAHLIYSRVGAVELDVVVEDGREEGLARVVAVRVRETPGSGVTGMSIAQVSIQRVLDSALAAIAVLPRFAMDDADPPAVSRIYEPTRTLEEATVVVRSATRKRVSDERLARIGAILNAGGGVEEVMAAEHVGDRQAFRLIARAKGDRR